MKRYLIIHKKGGRFLVRKYRPLMFDRKQKILGLDCYLAEINGEKYSYRSRISVSPWQIAGEKVLMVEFAFDLLKSTVMLLSWKWPFVHFHDHDEVIPEDKEGG